MNYYEVLVWPGGGTIGLVLWVLSIGTVAIIVQYFFTIRRNSVLPETICHSVKDLVTAGKYREVVELTGKEPSLLSSLIHSGLRQAGGGYPAMERAIEESAADQTRQLLRQIERLNLIGNISPMLGLLGTVWGMINAFFDIVAAGGGTPDPSELAGSIGIALVTTLLGLAIAIPALAVYSIMRNRIDALTSEAMVLAQELLSDFRLPKQT